MRQLVLFAESNVANLLALGDYIVGPCNVGSVTHIVLMVFWPFMVLQRFKLPESATPLQRQLATFLRGKLKVPGNAIRHSSV